MKYIDADKLLSEMNARIERCEKDEEDGYPDTTSSEATLKSVRTFITSLQQEHPSLSSNLDKAARKYAKTTFKKPHSDNPDEEVTIVEPDKYAGFIAGAKWDKEQMMSNAVEGTVYGNGVYTWVAGDIPSQFKYGDKVRIIIVKE